jgi:hypothetical protein
MTDDQYPYTPLDGYSTPETMHNIENIDVQVNSVEIVGVSPVSGQIPVTDSATETNTASIAANTAPSPAPVGGQKAGVTTAVALGSSTACRSVLLRADPSNTKNVLVGDSTHQFFPITTSDTTWLTLPVANLNLIYVASADGSTAVKVNYIILP